MLISAIIMGKSILSKHLAELGRKGGKARLKTMTAEERKASTRKLARKRRAREKKR